MLAEEGGWETDWKPKFEGKAVNTRGEEHRNAPVISISVQTVVLLRTWFAQQAKSEVNIIFLVRLSVSPVGTDIDHRLPTNMEQKTCDGHLILQFHYHSARQKLTWEVEQVGVVEHDEELCQLSFGVRHSCHIEVWLHHCYESAHLSRVEGNPLPNYLVTHKRVGSID